MSANVRWFSELGMSDLEQVGGKNASLGEMVSQLADLGVRVPNGFATTAAAYRSFICGAPSGSARSWWTSPPRTSPRSR